MTLASGVLTGKCRNRAGTLNYQVAFPDGGRNYHPEYELQFNSESNPDIYDLIAQGRFGRVSDLRRNLLHTQLMWTPC